MISLPRNINIKAILRHRYTLFYGVPAFTILLLLAAYFFTRSTQQEQQLLTLSELKTKNEKQLRAEAEKMQQELVTLKNRDEFKINQANEEEIKNINTKYKEALKAYESIQDLKVAKVKTDAMEVLFAKILNELAEKNYASASSILASALLELAQFATKDEKEKYQKTARTILESLSTEKYRNKPGENGGFILKHSVGAIPYNSEVDVPLTYADYYFLEALMRYKKWCLKN